MKKILFVLSVLLWVEALEAQIMNTRKWRKTEKDSLDNGLLLYDEKNYLLALPIFDNIYHNHPKEEFLKYIFGKCALYRSDKHDEAYQVLSDVYGKNKKVQDIEYDLAKAAHLTNRFDEAITLVEAFLSNKRTNGELRKNGEQLKRYINNAKFYVSRPTKAKISNLGSVINTGADEFVPTITADESIMIFTYAGEKSKGGKMNSFLSPDPYGIYYEDIYMTVKQNDEYSAPVALDNINTNSHDAAISLSHDGQILFIYRDSGDDHGDIYQSLLQGDEFSNPVKLKGQVNSYSWDGHCSLSPDGQTLYFSSERSGGYGGRDIYKATLLSDSTWGNIKNLGDSVNTAYDDDAPFIHPDGITLYFSSKGRTSMGGYDVFQSTMDVTDSIFKYTENLGYPINSTDDDAYFVLSANGKNGYYSSGKKGGNGLKDLYVIETNFETPRTLMLVKGKITNNDSAVASNVRVEIASRDNLLFRSLNSNAVTGQYLITLPSGAEYKITYTYNDKPAQTFTVSTVNMVGYNELTKDVKFDDQVAITPTLAVTPTVATISAESTTVSVPSTKSNVPDNFVPRTKMQEKIMAYVGKYGDVSAEGLEFRVQIAAYKYPKNYVYKHLRGLGKVEKLLLDDGITRITIGSSFKTLRKAWSHNKKVVRAGQTDAFVTVIYKGKRVYLEQLEQMGIFVQKDK
jgi:Tol biopolymer transport system component